MKDTLLHTAIALWILCWMRSSLGWFWIALCILFLYRIQKKQVWISLCLLLFVQIRISQTVSTEVPPASFSVQIKEIKSGYAIGEYEQGSVLLYDVQDVAFQDTIQIEATCEPISGLQNFHQFSFSSWAEKRGILYGCTLSHQEMIEPGTSIRAKIYRHIMEMEEGPRTWLLETLYGIHGDEQTLSYMVSSSGMHMNFVVSLWEKFLALWLPAMATQLFSVISFFVFGNCFLWKDSLIRILCFRIARILLKPYSAHDRLGLGMILVLLFLPYLADELAFVLPVAFRLCFLFNVRKQHPRLISFLVLIPIQFFYFNEIDPIQILLFPIYRTGYGIAFLMALFYLFMPLSFLYGIAKLFLQILTCLDKIRCPFYYAASLPFLFLWFGYGFLWLAKDTKKERLILVMFLLYTQISPYVRPYMEVMMIDVGQGDCTLISLPFHQGNILIDVAGNKHKNLPEDAIVPALHARGIRKLDLVIITHDDFDHSGGLPQLQELMEVEKVITEKQDAIRFGSFQFSFLLADQQYEDTNENSIVTFLEAYGTRLLFMGDAGAKAEEDLLLAYPKLRADILKVGHHGSKSSSSLPFLHQLQPSLALISCGAKNFYGHPSPITMKSLEQENIQALQTPKEGAVSMKFSNFIRFYKTATNEFGIIKNR